VQAPVIIYNEVFQALALEGDVLTWSHFWTPPNPPHSPDLTPLDFHIWESKKISLRPAISIWQQCQTRGPEMASAYHIIREKRWQYEAGITLCKSGNTGYLSKEECCPLTHGAIQWVEIVAWHKLA
jgi:hypothetical protein